MPTGELRARHYQTGEPVELRWREGKIASLASTHEPCPKDRWVAPTLVDLQVNGYAGVDFQQDHCTAGHLLAAVRALHAAGCGRMLLTLITDEWPRLMNRLSHLRGLREQSPELRQTIAGWHIEGPFLCPEPGFAGAHRASAMCDATPEHIHELRVRTGTDPVLLTLAPERRDAIPIIELACSLGIKVSLGHTDATPKRLRLAINAGATSFTHLANGCPRLLDRRDNILWRLFETSGLKVSLIPDTIHVSAPLFRIIHRQLGAESIYYITDAMAAAGAPPGRYTLGSTQIEVGEDQVVQPKGSQLFAGSSLVPIHGVFRAAEMLESSWRDVWPRFSDLPAQLMDLPGGLQVGQPASFCILSVTPESWLERFQVCINGTMLSPSSG